MIFKRPSQEAMYGSFSRSFTALMGVIFIFGTCGYVLIEGWTIFEGMYMTVITLSTVGYSEMKELSDQGRFFTAILIGVSVVSMACWTASITSALVSGDLTGSFKKTRERKMINRMKNHVIVCGGGILARTVIDHLYREQKEFIVITDNSSEVDAIQRNFPDTIVIEADPKSEFAMADANALNADYLIAASEDDFDNLLITITGRGLDTKLKVISCAQSNELASRMFKVGADDVICPLVIGGREVAKLVA